jgi:hypothetical protein
VISPVQSSCFSLPLPKSRLTYLHTAPCRARFVDIQLLFHYPDTCGGQCWFYTGHRSCEHPTGPVQCCTMVTSTSAQLVVDGSLEGALFVSSQRLGCHHAFA